MRAYIHTYIHPCIHNSVQFSSSRMPVGRAARIGRRNLEKLGEHFLQSARYSSLGPAGSKNDEIFRQVCPQFPVLDARVCQSSVCRCLVHDWNFDVHSCRGCPATRAPAGFQTDVEKTVEAFDKKFGTAKNSSVPCGAFTRLEDTSHPLTSEDATHFKSIVGSPWRGSSWCNFLQKNWLGKCPTPAWWRFSSCVNLLVIWRDRKPWSQTLQSNPGHGK